MIGSEYIFYDKRFKSKDEVIDFISQQAVLKGICDNQENLKKSFLMREEESSTGMMDGFAIPHAKSDSIRKPTVVIVQLSEEIEWNSMDGQPISFIIALLVPEKEKGTTYLKILSTISRNLMNEHFRRSLKEAKNSEQIMKVFEKFINE